MRQDLIPLFLNNTFRVNVDDDYRIVIFQDIGSVKLPPNLPHIESCPGPSDRFLREHFRWCLMVYLFGGVINQEYLLSDIMKTEDELGLLDDGPMLPLDDPKWQTALAKEILEDVLLSKMYWSEHLVSSDYED